MRDLPIMTQKNSQEILNLSELPPLTDQQIFGINFIIDLMSRGINGLIADEMVIFN